MDTLQKQLKIVSTRLDILGLEVMRNSVEEAMVELNMLRAQLKAAQEQEPFGWFLDINFQENIAGPYRSKETAELAEAVINAEYKKVLPLYAAPVPAEIAKEWRGTNEYGLDMGYLSGKIGILLRDLDRHTRDEAARVLARLAMVADSSVFGEEEFKTAGHIPDTGKMVAVDENRNARGEPDAIYLQIHGEEYEQPAPDYCGEVSWCSHKIHNADVRYVREDLAATSDQIAEAGKMIEIPDDALQIIKSVAHIGIDYGYGKHEISDDDIKLAREIFERVDGGAQ